MCGIQVSLQLLSLDSTSNSTNSMWICAVVLRNELWRVLYFMHCQFVNKFCLQYHSFFFFFLSFFFVLFCFLFFLEGCYCHSAKLLLIASFRSNLRKKGGISKEKKVFFFIFKEKRALFSFTRGTLFSCYLYADA